KPFSMLRTQYTYINVCMAVFLAIHSFDDEYKSADHPPPFSTNPAPPEIKRVSVCLPQLGHLVKGLSLIFCSVSRLCPQRSQVYSYVIQTMSIFTVLCV